MQRFLDKFRSHKVFKRFYDVDEEDEKKKPSRAVYLNEPEENAKSSHKNNYISTTRYNFVTFLPFVLFEQFTRVANMYFLVIGILSCISAITPTTSSGKYGTLFALFFVVTVSMVKEGIEDYRRFVSDKSVNESKTFALRSGAFVELLWKDVVVGDLVRVSDGDFFPADLVLLSSAGPAGTCYIETANLDGETNLKIKMSVKQTADVTSAADLAALKGTLHCEGPNARLYNFTGSLTFDDKEIPVSVDSILLRGAMLRNTEWIYGLVIYTGKDTKLMMNQEERPKKTTTVEEVMTKQILIIFAILVVICFFCTVGTIVMKRTLLLDMWYLDITESDWRTALSFFTFMVLFSSMVPISLYVSMEMVKVCQCLFINWDLEMYYAETDTPAAARTSNLNEELGQIQYVFSDKTGTLTRNVMRFDKCTVNGIVYGGSASTELPLSTISEEMDATSVGSSQMSQEGKSQLSLSLDSYRVPLTGTSEQAVELEASGGFKDARLLEDLHSPTTTGEMIRDFLTLLAVCHTVISEPDPKNPGQLLYQAASPDEEALVKGAADCGFKFLQRGADTVRINADGKEETYQVLNILEFNSTRKRMSVVVRCPNGQIKLYSKGADTMILARLNASSKPIVDATHDALEEFAAIGLRTLCLARKVLDPHLYDQWNAKFHAASVSLVDRDAKLDEVAELIETELELLGATAIEDRLQDGVPNTLIALAEAKIKLWVLTGDKQETAINIGFSCGLLDDRMKLFILNSSKQEVALSSLETTISSAAELKDGERMATVIEGATLAFMLENPARFMELARKCVTVICCRVSPLQKAQVVEMVRKTEGAITLAIGDGANDVGMIQAAHIGIGISGKEGRQAVLASDYAIAQFRYLKRLLLVHGRWSYKRVTKCILYCFYKNSTLAFTSLWFCIYCAFSGQTMYDGWLTSLFNVCFTSLPIIAVATLDQDTDFDVAMKYPSLYASGHQSTGYNHRIFAGWMFFGLYHSVVIFYVPFVILNLPTSNGHANGLWAMGFTVFSALIVTLTLKLALIVSRWTWPVHAATWGSLVFYFGFILIVGLPPFLDYLPNLTLVPYEMMNRWQFWLAMFLTPFITLIPDFTWKYVRINYFTTDKVAYIAAAKKAKRGPRVPTKERIVHVMQVMNDAGQFVKKSITGFAFSADAGQADLIANYAMELKTPRKKAGEVSLHY